MQENTYLERLDYLWIRHIDISEIIEGVLDAVCGSLSQVEEVHCKGIKLIEALHEGGDINGVLLQLGFDGQRGHELEGRDLREEDAVSVTLLLVVGAHDLSEIVNARRQCQCTFHLPSQLDHFLLRSLHSLF